MWSSTIFFVVGGILALLMRIQLSRPENHFLSPTMYNQIFTMHGTTMIFLVVVPALIGFGNYLVPLMIGARDMAFPRLNALGFWAQAFGGIMLYFSFATSGFSPVSSRTERVQAWCVAPVMKMGTLSFLARMRRP